MDWLKQVFTGPPPHSGSPTYRDLDRIPLEDIIEATNNFGEENIIEKHEYWTVYKGELFGKKLAFVLANEEYIKLDRVGMLSSLPEHQNIVHFIGCCDKDGKKILVFEYPNRGGLDKYVSGAHLTWLMRLKICLDIASGLKFLQTHDMEIKDLNSAIIHLDDNWQAKIQLVTPKEFIQAEIQLSSLMRMLSVDGDRRITQSEFIQGFTKWLDNNRFNHDKLYKFGVILFELLCARLAVTYDDEEGGKQFFSKLMLSHYEKGTLTEVIDPLLKVQMNRDSIAIFSEVAYRCLNEDPSIRPTISVVTEQLQKVLKLQQGFESSKFQQVSYCQYLNVIFLFS